MLILPVEITNTIEDLDNGLWILDFRNEERKVRGKIELPKKTIPTITKDKFTIEIIPLTTDKSKFEGSIIAFNAKKVRLQSATSTNESRVIFSAGGLQLRLFSASPIQELASKEQSVTIIVR